MSIAMPKVSTAMRHGLMMRKDSELLVQRVTSVFESDGYIITRDEL
jgi:hypothetical protein